MKYHDALLLHVLIIQNHLHIHIRIVMLDYVWIN